MSKQTSWTEQEDQQIIELRQQGLSFGIVADKIRNFRSRSAVIGRARRLGLSDDKSQDKIHKPYGRQPSGKRKKTATTRRRVSRPQTKPKETTPEEPQRFVCVDPVPFLEAKPHQCRWPVGRWEKSADCSLEEKHVCGMPAKKFGWCEAHLKIGTQEPYGRFSDKKLKA